jgi:hypothetical protein
VSVRHGAEKSAREALYAAAPDLTEIILEENNGAADFVPLAALGASRSEAHP